MADMLVDGAKLDACLDAEADAIRAKTGDSNDITFDFANNKGFADAIAAIPSGTTITDGIVVKARDADGYPTEVDVYGDVSPYLFSYRQNGYDQGGGWKELQTINLKTKGCKLHDGCFGQLRKLTTLNGAENVSEIYGVSGTGTFTYTLGMTDYSFPNAVFPKQSPAGGRIFNYCNGLKNIFLPKASGQFLGGYFIIQNCPALESVQMGSVGHAVTAIGTYAFQNCTQTGLTITIYSIGGSVDQIVRAIRYYATNAVIIIKASEATTYNGTSYAAGDTILTSEVTS